MALFQFKKSKVKNYDITLKNFLLHLIDTIKVYEDSLADSYTKEEKDSFIYNCAINTAHEYLTREKIYLTPKVAFYTVKRLFEENMKLQQFYDPIELKDTSEITKYVLSEYKIIKNEINEKELEKLERRFNVILAST